MNLELLDIATSAVKEIVVKLGFFELRRDSSI